MSDRQAVLPKLLRQIRQTAGDQTDGQLLARFVAGRDEDAFAALVCRHGPMVLGVCRRVLRHIQDAEDAFQATFLVLARKAAAVARRDSVGCYLYAVAYHTALEAARANARRRARERQVEDMPHPEVAPAEALDWLSEKYRAAVVLCDLGGQPQRQAATLLGVSLSTLSSRLTRARALLAKRLSARGLAVPYGVLAAALAAEAVSAQVSAAQASSVARVAALVAAGQVAGEAAAPVVLMKGVMQAMLLKKLRLVAGAVLVTAALGAFGLASRTGGEVQAQETKQAEGRSGKLSTEAALRREIEDLRATVRVLLKEIHTLQKHVEQAQARPKGGQEKFVITTPDLDMLMRLDAIALDQDLEAVRREEKGKMRGDPRGSDAVRDVEAALNALRLARDVEARRRAAEALQRATDRVREQLDPRMTPKKGP
jgi:RNA polymerase sigma factor (sigma-70 family)